MRAAPPDAGGDGMRALLRAVPLAGGMPWPDSLRVVVDLMLGSRFPMCVAWGSELRLVYNDAFIELLGERHPDALGQPLTHAFTDAWASAMPIIDAALAGEAALAEDLPLDVVQDGRTARRHVTLSCSPLRERAVVNGVDGADSVAGVLCVLSDTTARVLAAQQHRFQRKLNATLRELLDPVDIMEAASALVGRHLAVGRVGYGEIDAAGQTISVERDWTDGTVPSLAGETRPLDCFGPALIGELRAGRSLQLDEIAADPLAAPYAAGYASIGARAVIAVPIIEAGRLAAVFYLHEAAPRDWSAREVALAEDVARQTREAVRRARVEETLRDETRILELLNRTGQALASTLDADMLLQAITDAGTQLSGARFGAFFYTAQDERGENLLLYALSGAPRAAFDKFDHPRPTAVFGPTFHNQGIVRSDDITLDPRYGRTAPHHGMPPGHLSVRSYLAVPVVARSGAVLGGLFFGHPEPGVFSERTERIVAGMAAQAAVALDNARLYEAARKSALERESLLQSERAARVEAERLSRMKDEFLAMLAHELRNPLAPISSSAALLNIQFREEPRIRQASAIIGRQVKHMSRLIDDLLDVSRVTRGLVTLQVDEVDLREVVRSALDQARPLIDEKSHRVELVLPNGPVQVRGDATRLVQAVANILNNAAKYTPPAGTIRIALTLGEGRARVEVRDNGSGMPPDLLPSVFELFTQGARTLARSQGGLGLGLALVKKLVEMHAGAVAAHSDGVGLGSVFTIVLPCAHGEGQGEPSAGGAPARRADAAACRPLRVIVVDDNEDAADSLATLLRVQGHAVAVEYTGQGALRRAARERPDAIVVDIGLPDMDGYQLGAMLRAQPETRDAVLIAATGYGGEQDRVRARAAGFAHHLVKPVDMGALVRILQDAASAPRP
jgi:signal transduction histidine kinase/ActR/RegA family two-component response regulator